MKEAAGPTGDVVLCETCGGPIEGLRTSTTRFRHKRGLPRCPDHPPRPADPDDWDKEYG